MRDLAETLGLSVVPSREEMTSSSSAPAWPAWRLAVYGASEGLRTLLIERDATGGQAGQSSRIENYLGFPVGISVTKSSRAAPFSRPSVSARRSW